MRALEAAAEKVARFRALVAAAERGPELDERLRMLEPPLCALEHLDGLAQELLAGGAAFDEAERAKRDADRVGRVPDACAVDGLDRKRERFVTAFSGVHRECEMRAPVVE